MSLFGSSRPCRRKKIYHAAHWLQGSILPDSTPVSQLDLPPGSFLVSNGELLTTQAEIIGTYACHL